MATYFDVAIFRVLKELNGFQIKARLSLGKSKERIYKKMRSIEPFYNNGF